MKIAELIENRGRVKTTEKEGYRGYIHKEESFEEGSREELVQIVTDWFDALGWKTKVATRSGDYISRMKKHHTKITWSLRDGYGSIYHKAQLSKKTPNGGWATVVSGWRSGRLGGSDLGALVKQALQIPSPTMVTKETLPNPIAIGGRKQLVTNGHRVTAQNQWRTVIVKGVVGLKKDGTVDTGKAFEPTENPWFHCVVSDHNGATAHIITDGDELHPLNPRLYKGDRKYRVTTNVTSVVKNTTTFDKELLAMAISTLFESNE